MSRNPMFKPDGDQFLVNLAGCVLIAGDALHGNPAETTPRGRENSKRLIDRVLAEAVQRGFRHADTVRALLKRNQPSARLANLVQDACDLIEKPMQTRIMGEALNAQMLPASPEPETNPSATRPGPDGIDPRFWEAAYELERLAAQDGREAVHKPEHAHLYATLFQYAPEPLKSQMRAKAEELGVLPKVTHVGDAGQPVFSAQQLADSAGVSVQEIERLIMTSGIDPDDLYTGPVHPLQ